MGHKKMKIKTFLETNEDKNTIYHILCDTTKVMLRGKIQCHYCLHQEIKNHQIIDQYISQIFNDKNKWNPKKSLGLDAHTTQFYQTFITLCYSTSLFYHTCEEILTPIFLKLFKTVKREDILLNSLYVRPTSLTEKKIINNCR